MLERLSPAVRHFVLMLFASAVAVLGPFLGTHQSEFSIYVVDRLRLPLWTVPLIASIIGSLVLRFTSATDQYGHGSAPTTVLPPTPLVNPNMGNFYAPPVVPDPVAADVPAPAPAPPAVPPAV